MSIELSKDIQLNSLSLKDKHINNPVKCYNFIVKMEHKAMFPLYGIQILQNNVSQGLVFLIRDFNRSFIKDIQPAWLFAVSVYLYESIIMRKILMVLSLLGIIGVVFTNIAMAQEDVCQDEYRFPVTIHSDEWLVLQFEAADGEIVRNFGFINATEFDLRVDLAAIIEMSEVYVPEGWNFSTFSTPEIGEIIETIPGMIAQMNGQEQFGWGYADFIGVSLDGSLVLDEPKTTEWTWSETVYPVGMNSEG